jgi:nucleotide-binding universal stress UspA family protein/predicted transcriptional regulator
LTGKLTPNFYGYDRIVREILTLAKEGIKKKTIIDRLSLSEPLVRRITAELVNKDLLRYHDALRSYMTTAKGILYLRNKSDGPQKILVAVDGSESSLRAVDYAIRLASKEDNACVILLNILGISTAKQVASSIIFAPTYGLKEYERYEREAKKWLDKIGKKFEEKGIQTIVEVVGGPVPTANSILNYAENQNVDLIVVGTRGKSGIKKLLLGSVASSVVTHASSNVLVVK